MNPLKQHIKESFDGLEEIGEWISSLNDLNELLDKINSIGGTDDMEEHDKRYVAMILQKLMNDKEINAWFDSPYTSEYELRKILARKLSTREMKYIDELGETLANLSKNDNDPAIVNNLVMKFVNDPELEELIDSGRVNEFKIRGLVGRKLRGRDKKYFEPVCRKLIRIANDNGLEDDYFGDDSGSRRR